jgi:endonuclease/exonuclease/phosphatase family metal-dependent hydrolase
MLKVGEFCIASRYPMIRGTLIPINPPRLDGRQAYAVHLRIRVDSDTVSVVAVHLASPRDELSAALKFDFTKLRNSSRTRSQQAERLAQYLETIRDPLVIAGDFNTLEESQIYKRYFGGYTNAFRATSSGFGHTMQAGVHRLRIDHVLTGAGMRPVAVNTEWNWPTEHRPVIATLVY